MILRSANIPSFETKEIQLPLAEFLKYKPDFNKLKSYWQEYGHFKNLLIIGHGGSVTSFVGICQAITTNINVTILSTVDPDYIEKIKQKFKPGDTLVLAISKSGQTVTQIEGLMQFLNYSLFIITESGSVLEEVGKKMNAKIISHPPIGGRFTAFTEVALVPAAICGMDYEKIYQGGAEFLAKYQENNIAMQAAQTMYHLENNGIVDVFMPFYSHELFGFNSLIVQLCHESFGKDGKGQTYFAHEAPESEHHTNQRFFGGKKNIAGFFVGLENFKHNLSTHIPAELHSVHLRDGSLAELNKMPLSYAMHAEMKGTWEDAQIHAIPIMSLMVEKLEPKEVGAFIAFWQLYAIYSALLRNVDPFDQPQVETSKGISWNKRREFRNQ